MTIPQQFSLRSIVLASCVLILGCNEASASELEEGKALAKAKDCTRCHGLSGNTGMEADPPTPKIAGQPKSYLIKAMKDYRSGARKMEIMNVVRIRRA